MKKYFIIISLITFCVCLKANAQNDTSAPQQLRQLLGMTKTQYASFADSLTNYRIRQGVIQNNSARTKAEQRLILLSLWAGRRAFIQSILTPTQKVIFEQYERSRSEVSPRKRQLKEQEERMRQKGLQVTATNKPNNSKL